MTTIPHDQLSCTGRTEKSTQTMVPHHDGYLNPKDMTHLDGLLERTIDKLLDRSTSAYVRQKALSHLDGEERSGLLGTLLMKVRRLHELLHQAFIFGQHAGDIENCTRRLVAFVTKYLKCDFASLKINGENEVASKEPSDRNSPAAILMHARGRSRLERAAENLSSLSRRHARIVHGEEVPFVRESQDMYGLALPLFDLTSSPLNGEPRCLGSMQIIRCGRSRKAFSKTDEIVFQHIGGLASLILRRFNKDSSTQTALSGEQLSNWEQDALLWQQFGLHHSIHSCLSMEPMLKKRIATLTSGILRRIHGFKEMDAKSSVRLVTVVASGKETDSIDDMNFHAEVMGEAEEMRWRRSSISSQF